MTDGSSSVACDVLLVGLRGGRSYSARKLGLDVIVVEKEPAVRRHDRLFWRSLVDSGNQFGREDSREQALTYIRHEVGNRLDAPAIELFLDKGPEMLRFFESETEVKFVPTAYQDYHPDAPGGVDAGRSVLAAYNAKVLGEDLGRLRPPLNTITFLGMTFNSSNAEMVEV